MTNTNTALQVTNFDFYGDSLIALQDNATGQQVRFTLLLIQFLEELDLQTKTK